MVKKISYKLGFVESKDAESTKRINQLKVRKRQYRTSHDLEAEIKTASELLEEYLYIEDWTNAKDLAVEIISSDHANSKQKTSAYEILMSCCVYGDDLVPHKIAVQYGRQFVARARKSESQQVLFNAIRMLGICYLHKGYSKLIKRVKGSSD
jgi:hypothetical protein